MKSRYAFRATSGAEFRERMLFRHRAGLRHMGHLYIARCVLVLPALNACVPLFRSKHNSMARTTNPQYAPSSTPSNNAVLLWWRGGRSRWARPANEDPPCTSISSLADELQRVNHPSSCTLVDKGKPLTRRGLHQTAGHDMKQSLFSAWHSSQRLSEYQKHSRVLSNLL